MPREPRIPRGDTHTKSALHRRRAPAPLRRSNLRIASPYNFVTARPAFRIPLSFHAAGSDVYAARRHSALPLPTRGDKIRGALDSGVSRCNLQIHGVSTEIRT